MATENAQQQALWAQKQKHPRKKTLSACHHCITHHHRVDLGAVQDALHPSSHPGTAIIDGSRQRQLVLLMIRNAVRTYIFAQSQFRTPLAFMQSSPSECIHQKAPGGLRDVKALICALTVSEQSFSGSSQWPCTFGGCKSQLQG